MRVIRRSRFQPAGEPSCQRPPVVAMLPGASPQVMSKEEHSRRTVSFLPVNSPEISRRADTVPMGASVTAQSNSDFELVTWLVIK